MSKSTHYYYERRIKTLKRRRDFLDQRIEDYQGKDNSRDKAEASAIDWALAVIEAHYEFATDLIRLEKHDKVSDLAKKDRKRNE